MKTIRNALYNKPPRPLSSRPPAIPSVQKLDGEETEEIYPLGWQRKYSKKVKTSIVAKGGIRSHVENDSSATFLRKASARASIDIQRLFLPDASVPINLCPPISTNRAYAVLIRNLRVKIKKYTILNNVAMNVKENNIYAMLGTSGAGKTTLIRSILGRTKLTHGSILVFGNEPGTPNCGIPGPMVGYMPQDLALFSDLTLSETLNCFGQIFGLKPHQIADRKQRFQETFNVPTNRPLRNLSVGQMRRASFIIAIFHEPFLLILDEPMSGVDPMYRHIMWNYLRKLVTHYETTVIISTQYVEEAMKADKVGMLDDGRLIVESSPGELLNNYKTESLEDAFVQLFWEHHRPRVGKFGVSHPDEELIGVRFCAEKDPKLAANKPKQYFGRIPYLGVSAWTFFALLLKNFSRIRRNKINLLSQLAQPIVLTALCMACIYEKVEEVPFGCVNHDRPNYRIMEYTFAERIINGLSKKVFTLVKMNTKDEAIEELHKKTFIGFVFFPVNFTLSIYHRFYKIYEEKYGNIINGSTLKLYFDQTNTIFANIIEKEFKDNLLKTMNGIIALSEKNKRKVLTPYVQLVMGTINTTQQHLVHKLHDAHNREYYHTTYIPGLVGLILFFLGSQLTAMDFTQDRKEFILERYLVSGIHVFEVFLANAASKFVIALLQVVIVYLTVFTILTINEHPLQGNITLLLLFLLITCSGMSFGFFISSICEQQVTCIQMIIGSQCPNLLLNGVIWPVEAMKWNLKYVAYLLPLTNPIVAIHSLMYRGLGIAYSAVLYGFLTSLLWIFIFMCLTVMVLHRKYS